MNAGPCTQSARSAASAGIKGCQKWYERVLVDAGIYAMQVATCQWTTRRIIESQCCHRVPLFRSMPHRHGRRPRARRCTRCSPASCATSPSPTSSPSAASSSCRGRGCGRSPSPPTRSCTATSGCGCIPSITLASARNTRRRPGMSDCGEVAVAQTCTLSAWRSCARCRSCLWHRLSMVGAR